MPLGPVTPPGGGTATSADAVIGWVLTRAAGLRLSRAKTPADLVEAAVHVGRGTLSALGRSLPGPTTARHRIERAWWLCANDRVHAADVMPRATRRLTGGGRSRCWSPSTGPTCGGSTRSWRPR